MQVAPLVLLGRAVVLGVIVNHVEEFPLHQPFQRLVQFLVLKVRDPAHRTQPLPYAVEPERGLQVLVSHPESLEHGAVQVGRLPVVNRNISGGTLRMLVRPLRRHPCGTSAPTLRGGPKSRSRVAVIILMAVTAEDYSVLSNG